MVIGLLTAQWIRNTGVRTNLGLAIFSAGACGSAALMAFPITGPFNQPLGPSSCLPIPVIDGTYNPTFDPVPAGTDPASYQQRVQRYRLHLLSRCRHQADRRSAVAGGLLSVSAVAWLLCQVARRRDGSSDR